MRIILYVGIAIIVVLAILIPRWFAKEEVQEGPAKPAQATTSSARSTPVEIYVAEPSYISNGISAAGMLIPREEVELTTEVAGRITRIYFKEGTNVRKGDLLLKINDDDLQAQLVRAEFQEKLFAEKLERQKILLTKEAISREAYDQLETDYNMIVADMQLLKVRIEKTEIRAPFDGTIGFRYVSEGSYVQPGTKVARLVDTYSLIVEFSISEKYISLPLISRNIVFRAEGFKQDFHAKVYAVDPKLDEQTRTISLRANFDNGKRLLLPGMSADVILVTHESGNAIQVPTESIVPDMNGVSVWVVRNGRATSAPVETGSRTEQMIEIVSGLSVGDTVITSGIMQLRPNMVVLIQEDQTREVV